MTERRERYDAGGQDQDIDTLTLTTAHAASSYGVPVLVIGGEAYGPADMTPAGVTGAELVASWATRFMSAAKDQAPYMMRE